ncbi:MAG: metallophosphoesterase [Verrucomicrobia bacterium]|nr:metallophosphoesterase [Verrucomicrobiota bacterium]
MPIHLTPLSRRRFLLQAAAATGWLALRDLRAAESGADPHRFALFSDTHIAADKTTVNRNVNMADHLRQAVGEVRALATPPAALFVDGDCAYLKGLSEDYTTFTELMQPITEAKLPVHCTLGNHDDRDVFWAAAVGKSKDTHPLASKHVSVVKATRANYFLLDSLDKVNVTPGKLGAEQIEWLGKALDAHKDKPAIVFGHHQPLFVTHGNKGGLTDTDDLFAVLTPRKQVKAYIFGHTHHWDLKEHEGIHCVNLPCVGYPFNNTDPAGWVDLHLAADSATLELRAIDSKHPAHGQKRELKWRAA